MAEKAFKITTEAEYLDLMNWLEAFGFKWQSGDSLTSFYSFEEVMSMDCFTIPGIFDVEFSEDDPTDPDWAGISFSSEDSNTIDWHVGNNLRDYLKPLKGSSVYGDPFEKNIVPDEVFNDFDGLKASEIIDKVVKDDVSNTTRFWLTHGHADEFLKIIDGNMYKSPKKYLIHNTLEDSYLYGNDDGMWFSPYRDEGDLLTKEQAEDILSRAQFELVESE